MFSQTTRPYGIHLLLQALAQAEMEESKESLSASVTSVESLLESALPSEQHISPSKITIPTSAYTATSSSSPIRMPLLKLPCTVEAAMPSTNDNTAEPTMEDQKTATSPLGKRKNTDGEPSTPRFGKNGISLSSKVKGRPHKGAVVDAGIEMHVPQKRSVFRAFKYYFAKDIYKKEVFLTRKKYPSEYKKIRQVDDESMYNFFGFEQWSNLPESDKEAIRDRILSCKDAKTFQFAKADTAKPELMLLMELCYRFRKEIKEKFFDDIHFCALFLAMMSKSKNFLAHKISKVRQHSGVVKEIYTEFEALARSKLEESDNKGLQQLLGL